MWPIAPVEEFSLATRLDYAAKAGATTITVRAPVLNWSGRNIRLRSRDGSTTETRTVSSVDGRKVTLSVALTNAYAANSIVQMLVDYTDAASYQEVAFVPVEWAYQIGGSPAEIVHGNPSLSNNEKFGLMLPDGYESVAIGHIRIPPGYQDGLIVKAVVQPAGTGDLYHKIRCYFGKVGEIFSNTTVNPDMAAEAVTAAQIAEVGKVFTGLTVEPYDYLTMEYVRKAGDALDTVDAVVYVAGFLVYTTVISPTPAPDPI